MSSPNKKIMPKLSCFTKMSSDSNSVDSESNQSRFDIGSTNLWKNGIWYNHKDRKNIHEVEGNKMITKHIISLGKFSKKKYYNKKMLLFKYTFSLYYLIFILEYPDFQCYATTTLTFGKFGPTPKEISDICGFQYYNIQMEYKPTNELNHMKKYAVLNENGTHIYEYENNQVQILKWLGMFSNKMISYFKINYKADTAHWG